MLLILNYSPLRYAKSGALEFYDWELEHYPKETATRFARTGVGPRHEGSMDTACDLLPIYPRVSASPKVVSRRSRFTPTRTFARS